MADPNQERDRIYSKILNHNSLTLRDALAEESPLISALEKAAQDLLLLNLCLDKISPGPDGIEVYYSASKPIGAVKNDYWLTLAEKGVFSSKIVGYTNVGRISPAVGYEDTQFFNQKPFDIILRIYTRPVPESPKE